MNKDQQSKLRQAILEKLVEKEAEEKKVSAPLTEETKPQQRLTGTEKYAKAVREQINKDNRNRQKVIPEKTDLLAGDESVTAAQLRQSNQELWNRVQSSLSGLGGGGVGPDQIISDLEVRSGTQYINMSNWVTHDDNDSSLYYENSRYYSGVAYGQGKWVASTYMTWWLYAGGSDDQSYLSNAVAVSEDGENWEVNVIDDYLGDSYRDPV